MKTKEQIIEILKKYKPFVGWDEDNRKCYGNIEDKYFQFIADEILAVEPKEVTAEEIIKQIDKDIEKPLVSAQFGDMWKSHAIDNYNFPEVVNIAWKQGRRAILLERALRNYLGINLREELLKFCDFKDTMKRVYDLSEKTLLVKQYLKDDEPYAEFVKGCPNKEINPDKCVWRGNTCFLCDEPISQPHSEISDKEIKDFIISIANKHNSIKIGMDEIVDYVKGWLKSQLSGKQPADNLPSDKDIEAWAKETYPNESVVRTLEDLEKSNSISDMRVGAIIGAKAHRDGKITKKG
jgi:hypothetical protein